MAENESAAHLHLFQVPWGWMGVAATAMGLAATTLPCEAPAQAARNLLRSLRRGRRQRGDAPLAAILAERGQLALALPTAQPLDLAPGVRQGLIARFVEQAQWYFAGSHVAFDLPVDLRGLSDFQRRALLAAKEVPYGRTASYSDIARRMGHPRAFRAVGNAMARNPTPLVVPCHRIIAADGSLGGFGGNLPLKRRLLELEGALR